VHQLKAGDCLELSEPADCSFRNESATETCRYLVALAKRI
jgi:hypothetical protein